MEQPTISMTILNRLRLDSLYLKSVKFYYERYEHLLKELEALKEELRRAMENLPDVISRVEAIKESIKKYVETLPDEVIKEKGGGIVSIVNILREVGARTSECTKKLALVDLYISESPERIDPEKARSWIIEAIDACIDPLIEESKKIEEKLKEIFTK